MALIKGMTRKEYMRDYYLKHRPKLKYKQPCEHGLSKSKCKVCKQKQRKELYEAHKQERIARRRELYLKNHPPTYRQCIICGDTFQARNSKQVTCGKGECLKARRNRTDRELRASIRSHYGNVCALCGSNCSLEIDHKYGYGRQHREEIGITPTDSSAFYRWLRDNNYPKNYTVNGVTYKNGFRVLCKLCNNRQKRARYRNAGK